MNFSSLVEGSFAINRELKDGDIVDLGGGKMLRVIHTPGHSRGLSLSSFKTKGPCFQETPFPWQGACHLRKCPRINPLGS